MSLLSATSLQDYYFHLQSSHEPVSDGYGEYLVYSQEGIDLPKNIFEKAYKIFNFYNHNPLPETKSVTESISIHVALIRSDLKISFIPRTLHDLLYIRRAIKEEKTGICELQQISRFEDWRKNTKEGEIEGCWHIIRSSDKTPVSEDDPTLTLLAFRLNQYLVKKLRLPGHTPTGRDIISLTEKQLLFLFNHRRSFPDVFWRKDYGAWCGVNGMAINFGLPQGNGDRVYCWPMGVNNEIDAQIIRRAVALECHEVAQNTLLLYRAGSWTKDAQMDPESISNKSLAYGSSLFAGCVRDGTATVFHYTITKKRDTYAVVIPFKKYQDSPFHVPHSPALVQLLSDGEFFHPRSRILIEDPKCFKDDIYCIRGIYGGASALKLTELKSNQSPQLLAESLNHYHATACLLT